MKSTTTAPHRLNAYLRMRAYLSALPAARLLLAPLRSPAGRSFLRALYRTFVRLYAPDRRSRHEFNQWAEEGMDEVMELDHKWLAERILPKMSLASDDHILDLGCGGGWASRLIAERLRGAGHVVGLDISDEMVGRARAKNTHLENLSFLCGSADHIPFRDRAFTKLLSISAFYYFEHQEKVSKELFRIIEPEGYMFVLTCLHKGLRGWRSSARELRVPVHVWGVEEYKSMFKSAGWTDVHAEELQQEREPGRDIAGHDRALLVWARKPSLVRPELDQALKAQGT